MKQKYNDNFINKTTGEVEKRTQFGEFGNIWLCETEYIKVKKHCNRMLNKDIADVIEEADEYIEYNKDNIPMSYFYLKSWISRQSQWMYE